MAENAPLFVDHLFPAPVARAWHAWTDADELRRWFAKRANVHAVRGGPYELFWEPENPERNSTIGCRLTFALAAQLVAKEQGVEVAARDRRGARLPALARSLLPGPPSQDY